MLRLREQPSQLRQPAPVLVLVLVMVDVATEVSAPMLTVLPLRSSTVPAVILTGLLAVRPVAEAIWMMDPALFAVTVVVPVLLPPKTMVPALTEVAPV